MLAAGCAPLPFACRATAPAGSSRSPATARAACRGSTWAFVPLKPNELTPATAARRRRATASARAGRRSASRPTASRGLGSSRCRCGGISPRSERQHDLDEPGDAGRRLEVADVRLDRADDARRPGARRSPSDGAERLRPRSGRRAACRCRAPRRSRRRPARRRRAGSAVADQRLLGPAVGDRQPALRPSWLTADAADDARRSRSPSASASERRLSTRTPHALAAHVAVGARVERLAAPVGRHQRALRHADGRGRREHEVHAADERRSSTRPRAGSGRRGARRRATDEHAVSIGEARALEAEQVGQAAGGDAERVAGRGVGVDGVGSRMSMRRSRRCRCPTNTPASAAARASSARSPASSSASQATSSSRRCCGSIRAASRGEMPKNVGVEHGRRRVEEAAPSRGVLPGRAGRGRRARRRPSGSGAPSLTPSTPSCSIRQRTAPIAPPGNRHAMPTIASGSFRAPASGWPWAMFSSSGRMIWIVT